MATVSRNNAITNQDVTLYFLFLKNGLAYSPSDFQKVVIYPTLLDAQNDTNPIQTIDQTGDIIEVSTGKFQYTMNGVATAQMYYDKVFLIPEDGGTLWEPAGGDNINQVYVRQEEYGGATPGELETARITINLRDIQDVAQKGDVVEVKMNVENAWYGDTLIKKEVEKYKIDADGLVQMDLVETDTLTADTFTETGSEEQVYYEITISKKFHEKFQIPKGTIASNYKDLPKVL